jgi:outer membrane protein, heavy metal efflux system
VSRRIAALIAPFLICCSCVQYEPAPLDPETEVQSIQARGQSAWESPPAAPLPEARFPLVSAISLDDGLDIAEANTLALAHAPRLSVARRRFGIRGAQLLSAGLLSNPQASFGPRLALNDTGAVIPIQLAFQIPLGGSLGAERSMAEAAVEAARIGLLDEEAATLVRVRAFFIELSALAQQRSVLETRLRQGREALTLAQRRADAGELDAVALGVLILDTEENAHELHELEIEQMEVQLALQEEIGLLPSAAVSVLAPDDLLRAWSISPKESSKERFLDHPRLRRLLASHRAAEFGVELEIARQYPTLGIGPQFESEFGLKSLGPGISLDLPIFDQNRGGIAVARERRRAAREEWGRAALELARHEAQARFRLEHAHEDLGRLRRNTLPAADATERALEAQLRSGQSSALEHLAARAALARTRMREIHLRENAARYALEAAWASGELFSPRLDRSPER